jgi:hypothetical protein
LPNLENAVGGVVGANQHILRLWVQAHGTHEFRIVNPLFQYKLVLVFDVSINEVTKEPTLDAVIWLTWDIDWSVGQTATKLYDYCCCHLDVLDRSLAGRED